MVMKRKKKAHLPPPPSKTPSISNPASPPQPPIIINPNFTNPNRNYCNSPDDHHDPTHNNLKLLVRLPKSHDPHQEDSLSPSDSDPEDHDTAKERQINAGSVHAVSFQEGNAAKATGPLLESGPSTPLPDKKTLFFILDRIQKKDTHRVFAEPVDLNELPDYLEVVEQPMDFGTVRKKLDGGAYKCLEDLEADVFLISSNAMKYNAPNTIFFKQARSIQELAKRDFENLKGEGDDGEPQPKVVRRGRPPGNKNQKSLQTSPLDHVGTELSSATTLAGGEDKAAGSNSSYNLRKAPALNKFRSSDLYVSSYRSRNAENNCEPSTGWNDEFPASILRADMKHGKKHFTVDETRRDTYRQFHPLSSSSNGASTGHTKHLVPVGLQDPFSYARSLARYAADLGPVAWKIASKRIESVLPPGAQYGPGWVEESGASSMPSPFSLEKQKSSNGSGGDGNLYTPVTPTTSDLSSAVAHGPTDDVVRKLNVQVGASPWQMYESATPRNDMFTSVGNSIGVPVLRNGASSSHLRESWSSLQEGYLQQPDLALQL